MTLKNAFDSLTRLHSRQATLKRLGTPNWYSFIRISPSNYFRFIEGPSTTVIRGREFIIPLSSIEGHSTQKITFDAVPTTGSFYLTYNGDDTAVINFDDTAADVQTALQAILGLENVTVTGNFTIGFTVKFIGVDDPDLLTSTLSVGDELDADITIDHSSGIDWDIILKRGDRIVDTIHGTMTIDEILEIPDIGGAIMGYRVRCE